MISKRSVVVLAACALALPALARAQSGTMPASPVKAPSPVKAGRVYITGENPLIRLLDKADGTVLTYVSFWRVVWSPVGSGHICFVTTGDGKAADDLRIAIVDNRKLFDYVTSQMLGMFNQTYAERPFKAIDGTFAKSGDTLKEWKEVCRSERYTVELTWRDFYEPFQLDTPVGGPQNPFGITSLFIPAKSAEVMINGKKAPGDAYPQMRGPAQSSSAFLAFSESWVK